jgi:pimeloyl-ACP methyl ester carboxylesterase
MQHHDSSPPMTPSPLVPSSTTKIDGHRIEYRRSGSGGRTALILHGGHMSAGCGFGEEMYHDAGYAVLVVSRPGYGRTDVAAGPSAPEFAIRLVALCAQLGVSEVTAVGISLGARSALTLAAYAPGLVRDAIVMCPASFAPWPPTRARRVARVVFNPLTEKATWGSLHALLRRDPERFLPRLVGDLSVLPGAEVVARLGQDRDAMVTFLLSCRSGAGFAVDLRAPTDVTAQVRQPTLVLASRHDGSVDGSHPRRLADTLPDARLVEVDTPSHILWLGQGSEQTVAAVQEFLGRPRR